MVAGGELMEKGDMVVAICNTCKNHIKDLTCKAYPDRIPREILGGVMNHNYPLPDQYGDFIYEPKEKEEQE
jgi:hypothetical protein